MESCYNCQSYHLVETSDSITCISCAHVQKSVLLSNKLQISSDIASDNNSNDIVSELSSRFGLSSLEKSRMRFRLKKMSMKKSYFTKHQMLAGLYFISRLENKCNLCPEILTKMFGGVFKSRSLAKCVKMLSSELNLKIESYTTNIETVLELYIPFFNIYGEDSREHITKTSSFLMQKTNISLFSVVAISIVHLLVEKRKENINQVLVKISNFSHITKNTLKKNYKLLTSSYL